MNWMRCGLARLRGFALGCVWLGLSQAIAQEVDFNFHIRPLLSDRCFKCHGPDEKSRKAKLRLDVKESLQLKAKSGSPVIAPGEPLQSEVYLRVTSKDPDVQMPPPDSGLSINAEEIEQIRKWIAAGAKWKSHWAFQPVAQVPVPSVQQADWARNDLDRFVLARLEREGLKPSSAASKERLLRRVAFDLTGLPPTIEEMDAFLSDESDNAYDRLVERLLASSGYGERMATEWLDVARYADTYGYQADRFNHLWPWRDWVIAAFNANLPYDDFVIWQTAGDLLPNASREQRLATAFNRNHRQTNEGGSVNEEYRVEYNADRVHTTGTAFLGLTFECARCHDHKYDPITQREYYQLMAFFNSTDESGLYSHFTDSIPNPTLMLYGEGEQAWHKELRTEVVRAEQKLRALDREGAFARWLNESAPTPVSGLKGDYSFDAIENGKVKNDAMADRPGRLSEDPKAVDGQFDKALEFSGENSVVFEGVGEFGRINPFSFSLWLWIPEERPEIVILHRSKAGSDAGSRGYQIQLEDGQATFALIHFWPGNAAKVRTKAKLPLAQWVQLGVTYDGSSRAAGMKVYVNGAPSELVIERDQLFKEITYGDKTHLTLAARFRCRGFKGGRIDAFKVFDRELTPLEMAEVAGVRTVRAARESSKGESAASLRESLRQYYLANVDEPYRQQKEEVQRRREEEDRFVNSIAEIMVMGDLPEGRPTHILRRGAYDAPGEVVTAGTPASLTAWDASWPQNRLGLAQWLVTNPLTARVTVNRYWQLFFGRGLVVTAENFGAQGELPSHPELLDWLAGWFVEHDWDLKALCRLIVTSATYRQTSIAGAELRALDPENRLLARGPRVRLTAEMLRDQALAASGLLVRRIGGPSVKPYQPEGLWEEKSGTRYQQDKGEGLYRRSMYTFWKRTSPHPAMMTFDATSRETCVARRQTTSTPLQALVLMNDPEFVEASRVLGARMLQEETGSRVSFCFRLLTGRNPKPAEVTLLEGLYQDQRELFAQDPAMAEKFLKVGEAPVAAGLDRVELAACAALASAVMNLDDAVKK